MNIRFATNDDIPELKHIWHVCFGDSDAYIDTFFEHLFIPSQTVVACINSRVAGVVYMLKAKLLEHDFMYGYAIGVLPEHRGKDICKTMLYTIRDLSEKENFVFGLHPANYKLYTFYKRIGLNDLFQLKNVNASDFKGENDIVLSDVTADEYFKFRKASFPSQVEWDKSMLNYMINEARMGQGFAKKLSINGMERVIIGAIWDDSVYVKETTMTDDEIVAISASLKQHFKKDTIHFILPITSTLKGEIEAKVVGFGQMDSSIYMNLFLD